MFNKDIPGSDAAFETKRNKVGQPGKARLARKKDGVERKDGETLSHLHVVTKGEKPSVPMSFRSSGWRPVDAAWTRTNADFFLVWANRRILGFGAIGSQVAVEERTGRIGWMTRQAEDV